MWGAQRNRMSRSETLTPKGRGIRTTPFSVPVLEKEATLSTVLYRSKKVPVPQRSDILTWLRSRHSYLRHEYNKQNWASAWAWRAKKRENSMRSLQEVEDVKSDGSAATTDLRHQNDLARLANLYHDFVSGPALKVAQEQEADDTNATVSCRREYECTAQERYLMSVLSFLLTENKLLGGEERLKYNAHSRDRWIFSTLVAAYSETGNMEKAQQWWDTYESYKQDGWLPPSRHTYNTFMSAHYNAGNYAVIPAIMDDLIFHQHTLPNALSFHLLIASLLQNQNLSASVRAKKLAEAVKTMASISVSPRSETITMILSATYSLQSLSEYFNVHNWNGGFWSSSGLHKKPALTFKLTEPIVNHLMSTYSETYKRTDLALELLRKYRYCTKANYFHLLSILYSSRDTAFFGIWTEMVKQWFQPSQKILRHKIKMIDLAPSPKTHLQSLVRFYFKEGRTISLRTLYELAKAGKRLGDVFTLSTVLDKTVTMNNTSKRILMTSLEGLLVLQTEQESLLILKKLEKQWPEEARALSIQYRHAFSSLHDEE